MVVIKLIDCAYAYDFVDDCPDECAYECAYECADDYPYAYPYAYANECAMPLCSKQLESSEYEEDGEQGQLGQLGQAPLQPLWLSRCSLPPRLAKVLARCLGTDARCFGEIRFDDCALCDESVRALAIGMASNAACSALDLRVL